MAVSFPTIIRTAPIIQLFLNDGGRLSRAGGRDRVSAPALSGRTDVREEREHTPDGGSGADAGAVAPLAAAAAGAVRRASAHHQAGGGGAGRGADQALSPRGGARAGGAGAAARDAAEPRHHREVLRDDGEPVPGRR